MKIAINMEPKKGPWGGGNQFLELLIKFLDSYGHKIVHQLQQDIDKILMLDPRKGDAVKFGIDDIKQFKKQYPNVKCIHRINECDKRKNSNFMDELLKEANTVADYTVFISEWLCEYFINRWFDKNKPHQVICNAADSNIFYPDNELKYNGGKFKIVTHHWSNNWMKGFKVYQSVDDMIYNNEIKDFELMVIGRWPEEIKWKSALTVPPIKGKELADLLRKNHAYLTASLWEPCGMHHIEGAQCGLPLVYYEDGGGIVEFGHKYGIGFKDNVAEALVNMKKKYMTMKEKVLKFAPNGKEMCELYKEILINES